LAIIITEVKTGLSATVNRI